MSGDNTERIVGSLRLQQGQLLVYAQDLSRTFTQLREAHRKLEEVYFLTVGALVAVIEARDSYLVGHSRAVAASALSVGREMGLSAEQLQVIGQAALLHDIGKVGMHDSILRKVGPLDRLEWQQIRKHPELGYQMLSGLDFLGEALSGIRYHHERYDGRGYPFGLSREDIPLVARILSVCDAFDAMTSDRPYHRAMTSGQAIRRLLAGRGTQFDPMVADIFARVFSGENVAGLLPVPRWSDRPGLP